MLNNGILKSSKQNWAPSLGLFILKQVGDSGCPATSDLFLGEKSVGRRGEMEHRYFEEFFSFRERQSKFSLILLRI